MSVNHQRSVEVYQKVSVVRKRPSVHLNTASFQTEQKDEMHSSDSFHPYVVNLFNGSSTAFLKSRSGVKAGLQPASFTSRLFPSFLRGACIRPKCAFFSMRQRAFTLLQGVDPVSEGDLFTFEVHFSRGHSSAYNRLAETLAGKVLSAGQRGRDRERVQEAAYRKLFSCFHQRRHNLSHNLLSSAVFS